MTDRDPLRFTRPHRLSCLCVTCKAARQSPAERPPHPRPPEDGRPVRTPEQGRRPIQTRDRS